MVTSTSAHDLCLASRFVEAVSASLRAADNADAAADESGIDGEKSVGIDVRYHETSEFIRRERAKLHGLAGARVEWLEVCERGVTLLAQQSKDLSIAVAVATGLAREYALAGVAQGLEGIALLLERFGERLFPRRLSARDQALAWYFEQLSTQLLEMSITAEDGPSLNAATATLARLTQHLPLNIDEALVPLTATRRALERLHITYAELNTVAAAPAPVAAEVAEVPLESPAARAEAATSSDRTRTEAATSVAGAQATVLAAELPRENEPPVGCAGHTAEVPAGNADEVAPKSTLNKPGDHVYRVLAKNVPSAPAASPFAPAESAALAAALKREGRDLVGRGRELLAAEPLSVVGWHIWLSGLYLPLVTLPESHHSQALGTACTRVPPPQPHLLCALANDWPNRRTLGHLFELRALLEASRLCLDGLRALHETLAALDVSAEGVARVVVAQAYMLDARLPGIRHLRFADGSCSASPTTQVWLDCSAGAPAPAASARHTNEPSTQKPEGLLAQDAVFGSGAYAGHDAAVLDSRAVTRTGPQPVPSPCATHVATVAKPTLMPGADPSEAIAVLASQVATVSAGAEAFLSRLAFAELLVTQARPAAAKPVLDRLLQEAQARDLSTWQPQLVARLLLACDRLREPETGQRGY